MERGHYQTILSQMLTVDSVQIAYDNFKKKIERLKHEKRIIIYGAGIRGRDLKQFLEYFSVKVSAFFDLKAEQIKQVDDIPVLSAENAGLSRGQKLETYVFNAVNDGDDESINNYLKALGYHTISSISEWWFFNCWVNKNELFDTQKKSPKILEALGLWNDEKSIETYINNIKCYLTREYVPGTKIETEEQYFPKDFRLERGYECVVDCGAFDGDTILSIHNNIGKIDTLIAFEPDQINFARLKTRTSDLKEQIAGNLLLYPCGVWAKTEKLSFSNRGSSGSMIVDGGNNTIQCVALDDALWHLNPTLIKMDIEGAEEEALKGAENIIKRHKPDLCICLYHNINHLWDIPLLLSQWDMGYKFYLREYQLYNHETVMYATCPQ